nr:MAG TPA: hypothetical protein [Caudoviricetes sp.]
MVNCTERNLLSVYLGKGVVPFASEGAKRTNVTSLDLSKYQAVDYGDFVLNNQQAWRGSVGVSRFSGIVSPAYIVLSLNDSLSTDYANYLFQNRTMVDQYVVCSKGVGSIQRNLYWIYLKRVQIPVPPRTEQDQIVRVLDWKVSQINKLINAKKKQIGLLQEQKRAVINNVVTHGLNNDTPMKYSGVGWLGDVPANWEIRSLRTILTPFSEKNHPELPLLSVVREQGVILRDVDDKEANHNFIPDDLSGYKMVRRGQFVINKMKAWQGSCGVSQYDGIVSPAYFVFDLAFENKEYFHYAIRSRIYTNFFAQYSDGIRVGQWDLSITKMKSIPFFIPSAEEQAQIVAYIPVAIEKIEKALSGLEHEVSLLHEYRTRLISDVVTGKMDVCDVEVPQYEAVEEAAEDEPLDENEESAEGDEE